MRPRERGVNLYTRQPGEAQWGTLFQEHARFTLKDRVDDKPRHDHLFSLSEPAGPDTKPGGEQVRATPLRGPPGSGGGLAGGRSRG